MKLIISEEQNCKGYLDSLRDNYFSITSLRFPSEAYAIMWSRSRIISSLLIPINYISSGNVPNACLRVSLAEWPITPAWASVTSWQRQIPPQFKRWPANCPLSRHWDRTRLWEHLCSVRIRRSLPLHGSESFGNGQNAHHMLVRWDVSHAQQSSHYTDCVGYCTGAAHNWTGLCPVNNFSQMSPKYTSVRRNGITGLFVLLAGAARPLYLIQVPYREAPGSADRGNVR